MIWSPYRLRQLAGEEEYRAGEHLAERGGVRLTEQGADYVRYAVADEIRRDILISMEESAACSCDTYQEKGACRHVAAALLTAREAGVLDEMLRRRASSAGPRLMQAMESALPEDGTLRMEITLFVDQPRRRARPRIRLGLRVGEERLYVVRSIPQMIEAMKRQNIDYAVVDGFKIPRQKVKVFTFDFEAWTIIIASDGYPILRPTLAQSEAALEEQRQKDPLNIGNNTANPFMATKAFTEGYASFDDRSYVRFTI